MAKTSMPPGWPRPRWGKPAVAVAAAAAARVCGVCGGCFTLALWLLHLAGNTRPYLSVDWSDPLKDVNAETWRASLFTLNPRFFGSLWGGFCMGVVSVGTQTKCLRLRLLTRSWIRFALWNIVQGLFANLGFCGGLGFAAAALSFLTVLLALLVHAMHPRLPVSWEIDCMPSPPHAGSLPPTRLSAACCAESPARGRKRRERGGGRKGEGGRRSSSVVRTGRTAAAAAVAEEEEEQQLMQKTNCSRRQRRQQKRQQQCRDQLPLEEEQQEQHHQEGAQQEQQDVRVAIEALQLQQGGEKEEAEQEVEDGMQYDGGVANDRAAGTGCNSGAADAAEEQSSSDTPAAFEQENTLASSSDGSAADHGNTAPFDYPDADAPAFYSEGAAAADRQAAATAPAAAAFRDHEDFAAAEGGEGFESSAGATAACDGTDENGSAAAAANASAAVLNGASLGAGKSKDATAADSGAVAVLSDAAVAAVAGNGTGQPGLLSLPTESPAPTEGPAAAGAEK